MFYFRAEPSLETSSVPLFDVNDCKASTGTGGGPTTLDPAAKTSYKTQPAFELLCKRLKPGKSAGSTSPADYEWARRDYLIISAGVDRYWGYVKVTVSGTTQTVTPVETYADLADATCDDIANFNY
jgi:hypothetical protein